MSLIPAAIIGGSSLLGGLLGSKSKSSGSQSNKVTPYARDVSATMLWDTFMNRLLGDSAYPMVNFDYQGTPLQVSRASLLDSLLNPKQTDALAGIYNKAQVNDNDLLSRLVGTPTFRRADGGR